MASSRSSVGRALYRESGPCQDGDPVPGDFFFFSFFSNFLCHSFEDDFIDLPFYTKLKNSNKKNRLKIIIKKID